MPSLLVQLEPRRRGHRHPLHEASPPATAPRRPRRRPPPTPADSASEGGNPVEAGGEPAQSGPGAAAEAANTAAATSDQRSPAAEQSGVDAADARPPRLPAGPTHRRRCGTAGAPGAAAASPTGLETVPLELEFVGDFFNLADFFHDIKRFVRVAGSNVIVERPADHVESVKLRQRPERFSRGSRPS